MAQTNTLQPPIDAETEIETICFDFGMVLAEGETIASISSILCEVFSGTDEDAADRLIDPAQIAASPTTDAPRAAVLQKVGTMLGDVVYRLQCLVVTTDGQTLSLWTHLPCVTPD